MDQNNSEKEVGSGCMFAMLAGITVVLLVGVSWLPFWAIVKWTLALMIVGFAVMVAMSVKVNASTSVIQAPINNTASSPITRTPMEKTYTGSMCVGCGAPLRANRDECEKCGRRVT